MALSANILEKLPSEVLNTLKGGAFASSLAQASPASQKLGLATGFEPLDQWLPDGGLLKGSVVELMVAGATALATSIGLSACRSAQQAAAKLGGDTPWCTFVDPSRSLYAPGVAELGVNLERLLVVRPSLEALSRTALRLVESQCFAVVVIDTVGMPGAELDVPLGNWPRIVRRLAMALEGSQSSVLLITDVGARRPLTLPVAQRIELHRASAHKLILQVAKDRRGRISKAHTVALGRSVLGESALGKSALGESALGQPGLLQEPPRLAAWGVGWDRQVISDVC
jgi:recombination protein RecA